MTFEQYLSNLASLEAELDFARSEMRSIPGVGSGVFGLTPDAVKASPRYRNAKSRYEAAFAALRKFNRHHAGEFEIEYRAHLRALRIARRDTAACRSVDFE